MELCLGYITLYYLSKSALIVLCACLLVKITVVPMIVWLLQA